MTGDEPCDCGNLRCNCNVAVDLYQHKACTESVRVPTRGFILAIKQAFSARTVTDVLRRLIMFTEITPVFSSHHNIHVLFFL
jgi:hypothetical protein